MAETKYRDAYVLLDLSKGKTVYANTKVSFATGDGGIVCALDEKKHIIGSINCYVEDIVQISDALATLRNDHAVPVSIDEAPAFVNAHDVFSLGLETGVVVSTLGDKAIIYCGVVELKDGYTATNAKVFMDNFYESAEDSLKCSTEDVVNDFFNMIEAMYKEPAEEKCNVCPEEREEKISMDNLFGNLGFGKLRGDRFKLSMNGIAVAQKNTGKYVVYNKDNNEFVDATNTVFDIKDALFVLPAVEVNVGDTIIHEDKPYFIVDTTNEIKAVSYDDCTQTVLIPKSTMFGIKYFTKVFSMFGDSFASTGDIFSNPMMLMALMEGKNSDLTQLMLLSSLNNGELGSNPMALAMMLKGDKSDDSLSTIALMSMFNNGTNPFAPKKKETKTSNTNK